ncbi:MAG: RidA family protein [Clostridium sp.]|uniref:RidA family protein n=1 Tax=Clostridium TaxID=1485 RepID=UPI00188348AA|nr:MULTISPECIES: RidA family protein [Clostridium]MCR6514758.1 RidA family protein [Clostridium sp. LY3-2]
MLNKVHTDKAPKALGPYSQAIKFKDMVFTSGQIAIDPATSEIVGTDIKTQTKKVMENLEAVLKEAGTSFDKVIKTTCFLDDMADFGEFNQVYSEYIKNAPARSCVAVKELPKKVLCEVEVIAYVE